MAVYMVFKSLSLNELATGCDRQRPQRVDFCRFRFARPHVLML